VAVAGGTALADTRALGLDYPDLSLLEEVPRHRRAALIQLRCLTNLWLAQGDRRNAYWTKGMQFGRGATHVIFLGD
jgi:hypothetical protein